MHIISVCDFAQWRAQARRLLQLQLPPSHVQWLDQDAAQGSLFDDLGSHQVDIANSQSTFTISRAFINLAEKVACYRSEKKWALLYAVLWRMRHGEAHLLQISTDDQVHELLRMQKAVTRDAHKMKAFVRFKLYQEDDEPFYIAWHRPDHKILKLVAPFFQRRFSVMQWTIVTPDGAVFWDGEHLQFDESVNTLTAPLMDEMEELWRTYYRAIFNPARIKLKAMRREMPVRHWGTMPETRIISEILQEAPQRVAKMLQHSEGLSQSAADFLPEERSISNLRKASASCQGCDLHRNATQTLFGIGPEDAEIMLVGEQPCDSEDRSGTPFVGPAGKVLDELLMQAGVAREKVYLTNAVKHFKYTLQAQRRLHRSPNVREINACKPWLSAEIAAVKPKKIICLGLIAAKALISHGFHMKMMRGQWQAFSDTQQIMATYHPSAVLRAVNDAQRQEIYDHLLADLRSVKAL